MENNCNNCGSENTYGMSRVVGYYSIIENWNASKQAELVDRKKGDYKIAGVELCESPSEMSLESEQPVIMVH